MAVCKGVALLGDPPSLCGSAHQACNALAHPERLGGSEYYLTILGYLQFQIFSLLEFFRTLLTDRLTRFCLSRISSRLKSMATLYFSMKSIPRIPSISNVGRTTKFYGPILSTLRSTSLSVNILSPITDFKLMSTVLTHNPLLNFDRNVELIRDFDAPLLIFAKIP